MMDLTVSTLRGFKRRESPDSAWPLRDAQGRTWADRKREAKDAASCTQSAAQ